MNCKVSGTLSVMDAILPLGIWGFFFFKLFCWMACWIFFVSSSYSLLDFGIYLARGKDEEYFEINCL